MEAAFIRCLFGLRFTAASPALKPMLVRALRELWAPPADLARARTLADAGTGFHRGAGDRERPAGRGAGAAVARRAPGLADALFLTMLEYTIVSDPALERLLTGLRAALLAACAGLPGDAL